MLCMLKAAADITASEARKIVRFVCPSTTPLLPPASALCPPASL